MSKEALQATSALLTIAIHAMEALQNANQMNARAQQEGRDLTDVEIAAIQKSRHELMKRLNSLP